MIRTLAELTEYPKIYKDSYWGNALVKLLYLDDFKQAIENRNSLVKDFNIVAPVSLQIGWYTKTIYCSLGGIGFDHIEFYKCGKNGKERLMIVSAYVGENSIPFFMGVGLSPLPSVYNRKSLSFYKVFENGKAYRAWCIATLKKYKQELIREREK